MCKTGLNYLTISTAAYTCTDWNATYTSVIIYHLEKSYASFKHHPYSLHPQNVLYMYDPGLKSVFIKAVNAVYLLTMDQIAGVWAEFACSCV